MKLNDDVSDFGALRPGLRSFVKGVGVVLAIWLVGAVGIGAYTSLDEAGWITHNHDTPVWIAGDWIIGEYRTCQLLTTTPIAGRVRSQEARTELPRLLVAQLATRLTAIGLDQVNPLALAFQVG
jgi:hypothetical protein